MVCVFLPLFLLFHLGAIAFPPVKTEGQVFRYENTKGVIHYSDVHGSKRFERIKKHGSDNKNNPSTHPA